MNITQSLAYLECVLAHGPAGYAFVDNRLHYVKVNTRLAEINGLSISEHIGQPVSEILGPELWAGRQLLFERALAGEASVDLRLPGLGQTPEGSRGVGNDWVRASYYPVRSGDVVIGVAVIVRDISDQARAEATLAIREQEYRLIFDANPQPMWVYDIETLRFLDVNDAAVHVYGYSRAEFLARTIADIRPTAEVDAMVASVRLPRTGAWVDGPWQHLRKDGSPLWVEIASNSLEFQGYHARLILATDVTERQAIEQERQDTTRRQQTFLRDVLASVTEGKLQLCGGPDQLPSQLDSIGGAVPLTQQSGLYDLRHLAQALAAQAGHDGSRQYDLMTAASEAGMNAIVHAGGGTAEVSVNSFGTVQVRVEDQGTGITMENLPRATLSRGFSTKATLGHGLKMMLETADRLFLLTGPTGTTLVLEQDPVAPTPAWL
ncbi:MAG: PAS domain S-box protein [Janthinobacterium lividum]